MPAKAKAKGGCQRKDRKHQTSNARTETSQPGCPAQGPKNPKTQKPKNHTNNIPTTTQKTTSAE
ncbi:hypothetical protein [Paraburkholderia caribensis]|uniref:hypothetical protein n=1 Tax=Paraburkholderia caribensis TaxID=75105 RepID=UPI001D0750EF|nr:hypothetical protein [Paraburkholderia caribensis]